MISRLELRGQIVRALVLVELPLRPGGRPECRPPAPVPAAPLITARRGEYGSGRRSTAASEDSAGSPPSALQSLRRSRDRAYEGRGPSPRTGAGGLHSGRPPGAAEAQPEREPVRSAPRSSSAKNHGRVRASPWQRYPEFAPRATGWPGGALRMGGGGHFWSATGPTSPSFRPRWPVALNARDVVVAPTPTFFPLPVADGWCWAAATARCGWPRTSPTTSTRHHRGGGRERAPGRVSAKRVKEALRQGGWCCSLKPRAHHTTTCSHPRSCRERTQWLRLLEEKNRVPRLEWLADEAYQTGRFRTGSHAMPCIHLCKGNRDVGGDVAGVATWPRRSDWRRFSGD